MEDPKKCGKEEGDEIELKRAKALEEDFEKHKSTATVHIYGAKKSGTDSEDEAEDEEETTEDEPSGPEPAWEGLELVKNAYTKIIKTSHGLRVLHAKSTLSDIDLARGEDSIEAGNLPLAVKDLEAALSMKRRGPEDSRSLANARHQLGVAQDTVNSCKETAKAVLEAQVIEVLKANRDSGTAAPSKVLQLIKEEASVEFTSRPEMEGLKAGG